MGSVNKVLIIGYLGADPELRYTPNGNRAVCKLSVATSEVWKDKAGQKQERTEWHRVQVWGDLAENCDKYLAKGKQVYVEGKLQTRQWEDKKGGQKRYATEIVASHVVFLGSASGESQSSGKRWGDDDQQSGGKHREERYSPPPSDDDIPF